MWAEDSHAQSASGESFYVAVQVAVAQTARVFLWPARVQKMELLEKWKKHSKHNSSWLWQVCSNVVLYSVFRFFSSLGKSLFAHPNDLVHVRVFVEINQTPHEGHNIYFYYLLFLSLTNLKNNLRSWRFFCEMFVPCCLLRAALWSYLRKNWLSSGVLPLFCSSIRVWLNNVYLLIPLSVNKHVFWLTHAAKRHACDTSAMPIGLKFSVNSCLSLMWCCDDQVTCPGCDSAFNLRQQGRLWHTERSTRFDSKVSMNFARLVKLLGLNTRSCTWYKSLYFIVLNALVQLALTAIHCNLSSGKQEDCPLSIVYFSVLTF